MEAISAIRNMEGRHAVSNREQSQETPEPHWEGVKSNRSAQDASGLGASKHQAQAGLETTKRVAEAMDQYVRSVQSELEIRIHEETGKVLVKVISHETGEVIREIPPEEMIELAKKMEEMTGGLLRTEA